MTLKIRTILPPHLLRELARNGDAEQRNDALMTLSMDSTFRNVRSELLPSVQLLTRQPAATLPPGVKRREIYDAQNKEALPGEAVRLEGAAAVKEVAVNEAYDGLGATYDFYWTVLRRHSIDDRGLPLRSEERRVGKEC